jgi:hypothetical protein
MKVFMDQKIANSLRQALDLIKSGDVKSARPILVEILKTNPEIEQAWYMLSFAVPIKERQIYALNQVLQINPGHEKARDRLAKLTGQPVEPIPESFQQPIEPTLEPEKVDISEPEEKKGIEPEGDLLTQRLFGTEASEEEIELEEEPPPAISLTEPDSATTEIVTEPVKEEKVKKKKPKKPRKRLFRNLLANVSRRTLIFLVLIVIIGGIGIMISTGNIDISALQPSGTTVSEDTQSPTSTQTLAPTATEQGFSLPPTWTPPSPTEVPIPQFGEDFLFTLSNLPAPSPSFLESIGVIQNEVFSFRGLRSLLSVDSYLISDAVLIELLAGFSNYPEYDKMVENIELAYQVLGLVEVPDDLSDLPKNQWADPNGSVYLPNVNTIVVTGVRLNVTERYFYVRSFIQELLDEQYDLESLGIYPVCSGFTQRCDIVRALVKGDATFSANQWLEMFATPEEILTARGVVPGYFVVPMQSPPPFAERVLQFPYVEGLSFVENIFDAGGWESVNSAYLNLPSTTEQILHPEKYLNGEMGIQLSDQSLGAVLLEGWREVMNEPLGEWKTYIVLAYGVDFLAQIPDETAAQASAGWGGDNTQVWYNNDSNQTVMASHWVWDSSVDSSEFYNAISDYLSARFEDAVVIDIQGAVCWQNDLGYNCLLKSDLDVVWISAPNSETMIDVIGLYSLDS